MSDEPRLASVALHMDSLGWAAGTDATVHRDPTWFTVLDRFLELAERHRFRYTLVAIGRDLASEAVRARVRALAEEGHEIANHSESHFQDLGARPKSVIAEEVRRAHGRIAEAVGRPPVGFVAPAWTASPALVEVLLEAGYRYDASLFPSWMLYPLTAKLWWNFRRDPRRAEVLRRKDWAASLVGHRTPFRAGPGSLLRARDQGLTMLPMPTTPWLRLPCWHTLSFVLPERIFFRVLDRALASRRFVYVVHPADLMDEDDVPPAFRAGSETFERLGVPVVKKQRRLDDVLGRIAEASRMVTLEEMAGAVA